MSSPTASPYKSRLFSLLNRQSLKVREQLERTFRHGKLTLEWGLQILAYPVYLLVQTGRVLGNRLKQSLETDTVARLPSTEGEYQSQTMTSDRAIERVLQSVDRLISPDLVSEQLARLEIEANPSSTIPLKPLVPSHPPQLAIQGVASLLKTRRLVLVAAGDRLLDILSPSQQKKLQQHITAEVADYCYECRLDESSSHQLPGLISNFKSPSSHVLAPVRLFWRVMRWVQTSPVAKAIDLFGESQFITPVAPTISFPLTENSGAISPNPLVKSLDLKIAELEAKPLIPVGRWLDRLRERFLQHQPKDANPEPPAFSSETTNRNFWQIQSLIRAAIDYFFKPSQAKNLADSDAASLPSSQSSPIAALPGGTYLANLAETPAVRRLGEWVKKLPTSFPLSSASSPLSDTADSEPDPFRIQMLIQAAIDYFFVQTPRKLQWQSSPNCDDNILTSGKIPFSFTGKTPISLPDSQVLETSLDEDPWLSWEDLYSETPPNESIEAENQRPDTLPPQLPGVAPVSLPSKKNSGVTTVSSHPLSLSAKTLNPLSQSAAHAVTQSSSEDYEIETAYDWIETEAKSVGYVKHPLERILEWLDKLILWVEETILKVWKWLRSR